MNKTPPSDLTVTLRCNNACLFCPRTTLEHVKLKDAEELLERLEAIRAHSGRITLSGGEVTILPGVVDLVALCREVGFTDIAIITNGRKLSEGDLGRRLVQAGLTEACLTIYSLDEAVHDWFTNTPGSQKETLGGLTKMLAVSETTDRFSVRVNTLLSTRNADGMATMVSDLFDRGIAGMLIADVVLGDAFDEILDHARVRALASEIAGNPRLDPSRIVWRGFPLCVLHGIGGLVSEPQDIDTTIVDDRSLESYFDEFFGNFAHVDACSLCDEAGACPGPQTRYVEKMGQGSFTPIRDSSVSRDVSRFEPWPDPGRIAVTPTTACQMRCTYCQVQLGKAHAEPEVLDRTVDLLLTSKRPKVELQFFGGEPLLRKQEVMRTMKRGDELARSRGQRIQFTITTNGILLTQDVIEFLEGYDSKVLFSMDGPPEAMAAYRPLRSGSSTRVHRLIEKNLVALTRSSIDYFVNIVMTPDATGDLVDRIRYLAKLGVTTVQVCYALGPDWTDDAADRFCDALTRAAAEIRDLNLRANPIRMQNLGSHAEPVVLSNDLLVDVDGTLYGDAAIFAEKAFPGLRDGYRIGSIFELTSFDGLRRSREQNLSTLRATYPESTEQRQTVESHLAMGLKVQKALDGLDSPRQGQTTGTADRNPLLDAVLKRSVAKQAKLMQAHPEILKLPLLLLHNSCAWDCVFCKAKPLDPTPLARVSEWLEGNIDVGLETLGLVGNEPLAHPRIDDIIQKARECGFEKFVALTTGDPLADPGRCRDLFDAGVTAVSLPLFGSTPEVHDAISGSRGSHRRTMAVLENLVALGASIHVHTNLLRQNLDDLSRLERLVRVSWNLPFCVIPVRPKDANLPYSDLVVPYGEIIERARVHSLVAFPLCVAARLQDPPVPDSAIISDVLKIYVLDQPFVKPEKCEPCTMKARCAGTFQALLDLYGDADLTPFT